MSSSGFEKVCQLIREQRGAERGSRQTFYSALMGKYCLFFQCQKSMHTHTQQSQFNPDFIAAQYVIELQE